MKFEDMNPLQRRLQNAAIVLDAEGDEHGFVGLLREAIADEEAQGTEPVCEVRESFPIDMAGTTVKAAYLFDTSLPAGTKLFTRTTTPPVDHIEDVRGMVPMTDSEVSTALNGIGSSGLLMRIVRAVEAHHGIK